MAMNAKHQNPKSKKPKSKKPIARTTIVFTTAAEAVLQRYKYACGLKGPVSVGLLMFDQLPAQEKLERITAAEAADRDPQEILTLLRYLVHKLPEDALETIKPDEADVIRRYRAISAAGTAASDIVARASDATPTTGRKRTSRR